MMMISHQLRLQILFKIQVSQRTLQRLMKKGPAGPVNCVKLVWVHVKVCLHSVTIRTVAYSANNKTFQPPQVQGSFHAFWTWPISARQNTGLFHIQIMTLCLEPSMKNDMGAKFAICIIDCIAMRSALDCLDLIPLHLRMPFSPANQVQSMLVSWHEPWCYSSC